LTLSISIRRLLIAFAIASAVGIVSWQWVRYLHSPTRYLPKRYVFSDKLDDWTAYGGTWEVSGGAMQNASDERGAKLMTGSSYWTNYVADADLQLSGSPGDAGLIIRGGDEEEGVDAYSGYYAGLSSRPYSLTRSDNILMLGKANHDWTELSESDVVGGVAPFAWYHLRVLAYGCHFVASAAPLNDLQLTTTVSAFDPKCVPTGQIGLRSYATGVSWRNIVVKRATEQDLSAMLALKNASKKAREPAPRPSDLPAEDGPSRDWLRQTQDTTLWPGNEVHPVTVQSIASLWISAPDASSFRTLRGIVIATKPELYIQDSDAGIAVHPVTGRPFNLGDEVQATGHVSRDNNTLSLDAAKVNLLWVGSPMATLSVSATQAAVGSINPSLIQVKGYLQRKETGANGASILHLEEDHQSFEAVITGERASMLFGQLKLHSLLSVQGVCTSDPRYTHYRVSFVVLLRSTDDIVVIADPPWWNTGHVIAIGVCVVVLLVAGQFLYGRIENWRMRAVIDERARLAHEMHDTLSQSFAGIGFQLQAVQNELTEGHNKLRQHVDLACTLVRQSHEESRRCIATLRPESLEQIGLFAALERSARRMVEGGNVRVQVSTSGSPEPLPIRVSDTLFRIGQEAISNAVRHANAQQIQISILYRKRSVKLCVQDDGVGFAREGELLGFGLRGMRERAHAAASELTIDSAPGRGAKIVVVAPLVLPLSLSNFPRYLWKYVKEHQIDGRRKRKASSSYFGRG
jgi:signal transduction histidine kinase